MIYEKHRYIDPPPPKLFKLKAVFTQLGSLIKEFISVISKSILLACTCDRSADAVLLFAQE